MNLPSFNINGYKIPDGHFKLGSKLHLSDFYYARVMFQNSYFSNRIAFLIARYILDNDIVNSEFTNLAIIGYGKYSEQLVDAVKNILLKQIGHINIELDFISDYEDMKLLKNNSKIDSSFSFLIMIPIASTLSTSVKIVDIIRRKYGIRIESIISPIFSVLVVMDAKSNDLLDQYSVNENGFFNIKPGTLYYSFYWREISLRDCIIKFLNQHDEVFIQKYFIPALTQWQTTYDCDICFPSDFNQEKPLIETDKTSVSPNLLLSKKFNFSESKELRVKLKDTYHFYGNINFSNKTYLHFIDPNSFLSSHIKRVRDWLEDEVKPKFKGINFNKVVLLSPDGNLNSSFPSLVNELVFENKTDVIQFDTKNDFLENYIQFYKTKIEAADFVFYADDLITTGNSFVSVNSYVEMIRPNSKGLDGIIVMISRADELTYGKVKKTLYKTQTNNDRIFKFIQLNIPELSPQHMPCPINAMHHMYGRLGARSNLDSVKQIYLEKLISLAPINNLPDKKHSLFQQYDSRLLLDSVFNDSTNYSNVEITEIVSKEIFNKNLTSPYKKNFIKFLTMHVLFSIKNLPSECFSVEYFSVLQEVVSEELKKLGVEYSSDKEKNKRKIKEYIIKIISLPPFTYYKNIRQFILSVMMTECERTFDKIKVSPKKFTNYRYLKLLIKRLGHLKANYLISPIFLEHINDIYSNIDELDIRKSTSAREVIRQKLVEYYNYLVLGVIRGPVDCTISLNTLIHNTPSELLDSFNEKFTILNESYKPEKSMQLSIAQQASHIDVAKYTMQLIINNLYRSKTYKELGYFITSCINEVISENEAKAIKLEVNLKMLNKKTPDFFHLSRLLLLMNDGIIYDSLEKIRQLQDAKPNVIEELNSLRSTYEFEPLFHFLTLNEIGEKQLLTSATPFAIFLDAWNKLVNSKPDNSGSATQDIALTIKDILGSIKRFFGSLPMHASLTVAFKSTTDKERGRTGNYYYTFNDKVSESESLENSFIPKMMDGIQLQFNGPIQTLFETFLDKNGNWQLLKQKNEYYHNSQSLRFDEIEFDKAHYNHVLFIRIADLNASTNSIMNRMQGVLFFGFKENNEPDFISTNILRYLLLLRSGLSQFIRINSENDSFRSYVEANKKVKILSHFRHELRENKTYITEITEDDNIDIEAIKTLIDASFNQVFLSNYYLNLDTPKDQDPQYDSISVEDFLERIRSQLKLILNAGYGDGPIQNVEILVDQGGNEKSKFVFEPSIFSVLYTEIFKNIKNHFWRSPGVKTCFFRILRKNGKLLLEVGNKLTTDAVFRDEAIENSKNLKEEGGISLIKKIYHAQFKREMNVLVQENEFIYQFELNTDVT